MLLKDFVTFEKLLLKSENLKSKFSDTVSKVRKSEPHLFVVWIVFAQDKMVKRP